MQLHDGGRWFGSHKATLTGWGRDAEIVSAYILQQNNE